MADPAYRVFLSQSSKDKGFVSELYRRLTRDGVSCFFDIESVGSCLRAAPQTRPAPHLFYTSVWQRFRSKMKRASLTPDAGTICELNLLVPHAEFLLTGSLIRQEDFSRLATQLGTHYLALCLSCFGADHPRTQTIQRSLEGLGTTVRR